jgi:hypothetical protein
MSERSAAALQTCTVFGLPSSMNVVDWERRIADLNALLFCSADKICVTPI